MWIQNKCLYDSSTMIRNNSFDFQRWCFYISKCQYLFDKTLFELWTYFIIIVVLHKEQVYLTSVTIHNIKVVVSFTSEIDLCYKILEIPHNVIQIIREH